MQRIKEHLTPANVAYWFAGIALVCAAIAYLRGDHDTTGDLVFVASAMIAGFGLGQADVRERARERAHGNR